MRSNLYITIGRMWNISIHYTCTIEGTNRNHVINCVVWGHIKTIFVLSLYQIEIDLFLNIEMWWNIKLQDK
jgi:hypothetical protein